MASNYVFWEQKVGLGRVHGTKIAGLPRAIDNTGIPTVINKSMIMPRRFCSRSFYIEQSLDEIKYVPQPG
jgi:hypothetical protein